MAPEVQAVEIAFRSPPVMPSFPRKNLTKGMGEWNHYYIRAINGEIRLWVNGEEVSGQYELKEGDIIEVARIKAAFNFQD